MFANNHARNCRLPAAKTIVLLLTGLLASGCVTQGDKRNPVAETFASDDPCSNNARNIGILAGGLLGAVIGNQVKHSTTSRVLGAGLGATIGGLIGADIDRQRCELAKISKKHDIRIETTSVDLDGKEVAVGDKSANTAGISVRLPEPGRDGGHFATGSDQLTPKAKRYFAEIADTFNPRKVAVSMADPQARTQYLQQATNRKLFLVGHTDDTGTSNFNAELSERRARAVAQHLAAQGIGPGQIYYQGAGEMYPISDNNTESGRATNRRVELLEVADEKVFRNYLARRTANPTLFRPATPTTLQVASAPPANRPTEPQKRPQVVAPVVAVATVKAPPPARPNTDMGATPAAGKTPPANSGIDFGGKPYQESDARVDAGKLVDNAGFSLFRKAHADEPAVVASCRFDRPRHAGEIKALSDGHTFKTTEKLPGLYGRTWRDMVGGHLVVVNQLSILRDGGQATNLPEVKIYKDYDAGKPGTKPSLVATPQINVYQGANGTLVRSFFEGEGGLRCMDLLAPNTAPFVAKDGRLIYARASSDYVANFAPRMAD